MTPEQITQIREVLGKADALKSPGVLAGLLKMVVDEYESLQTNSLHDKEVMGQATDKIEELRRENSDIKDRLTESLAAYTALWHKCDKDGMELRQEVEQLKEALAIVLKSNGDIK